MCMICMRCGRCPGVEPFDELKALAESFKNCKFCGTEIPQGAVRCPECQAKVVLPPGALASEM